MITTITVILACVGLMAIVLTLLFLLVQFLESRRLDKIERQRKEQDDFEERMGFKKHMYKTVERLEKIERELDSLPAYIFKSEAVESKEQK